MSEEEKLLIQEGGDPLSPPEAEKPKRLSFKRRAFVSAYLETWNSSEAARRAGYKGKANVVGPRLLADVSIQAEVKRVLKEKAMTADEVLSRLAEQARADHSRYLTPDGVDLERLILDGKSHLVKSIKPTRYGYVIEFHDAQAALALIGKHLKLFTEAHEIDLSDRLNSKVERLVNMAEKVYGNSDSS